jgi:hypothetical protein
LKYLKCGPGRHNCIVNILCVTKRNATNNFGGGGIENTHSIGRMLGFFPTSIDIKRF